MPFRGIPASAFIGKNDDFAMHTVFTLNQGGLNQGGIAGVTPEAFGF